MDQEEYQALDAAINALRDCGRDAAEANAARREWFEGYVKACEDVRRQVIEARFTGRPLPSRRRLSSECPG